ncbi:MAG: hypothetical protein JXB85_08605 [Anaerolineales bacterium]|nr:hypothetical protein [Anaerolineales bacterium]
MLIETQINSLRQQTVPNPLCWIVCFKERPLQGIPPGGKRAHVLIFSVEDRALDFIARRSAHYGAEPLDCIPVDSSFTLLALAMTPAQDLLYAPPPCGIVLDFDYATGGSRLTLAPAVVKKMTPARLENVLRRHRTKKVRSNVRLRGRPAPAAPPAPQPRPGIGSSERQAPPPATPEALPPPPATPTSPPATSAPAAAPRAASQPMRKKKRAYRGCLLPCGSLAAVLCLVLAGAGIWLWMNQALVTSHPTLGPYLMNWTVNLNDDFSSNENGWPTGSSSEGCARQRTYILNGSLLSEVTPIRRCTLQLFPEIGRVTDFDVFVETQPIDGPEASSLGIVFRYRNSENYYLFVVNSAARTYAVFHFRNDIRRTIIDWTPAIHIRRSGTNRLGVSARGTQAVFYINGWAVDRMDDLQIDLGSVGLGIDTTANPGEILAEFDNFILFGDR